MSDTPRTDDTFDSFDKGFIGRFGLEMFAKQLERELNEAKAQIAMTDTAYRLSLKQLSALKKQIQDGELVPVEVALNAIQCEPELNDEMPDEMFTTMATSKDGCSLLLRAVVRATKKGITDRLKQFAAERAKANASSLRSEQAPQHPQPQTPAVPAEQDAQRESEPGTSHF